MKIFQGKLSFLWCSGHFGIQSGKWKSRHFKYYEDLTLSTRASRIVPGWLLNPPRCYPLRPNSTAHTLVLLLFRDLSAYIPTPGPLHLLWLLPGILFFPGVSMAFLPNSFRCLLFPVHPEHPHPLYSSPEDSQWPACHSVSLPAPLGVIVQNKLLWK